jgi:hypothetical protein
MAEWHFAQIDPSEESSLLHLFAKIIDQLNSNLILWKRIPAHKGSNKLCDAIARMFALRRIPASRRSENELLSSTTDVQSPRQ